MSVLLEEDEGKERTVTVVTVPDVVYELNKKGGEHGATTTYFC